MAGEVPENLRELVYGVVLAVFGTLATLAALDPWFRLRAKLYLEQLRREWEVADPAERMDRAIGLLVKKDAPGVIARAEELLARPEETLREMEEGDGRE